MKQIFNGHNGVQNKKILTVGSKLRIPLKKCIFALF